MVFLELNNLLMGRNISKRGYEKTAPKLELSLTCVFRPKNSEHVYEAMEVKPPYDDV